MNLRVKFFNLFFPHTRTIKKMYFSREFLRDGCSKTKFIGTTKRYARSCNRKRRKFLDYNARECSVRAIAWAVYYICIIRYSYDLRLKNVVYQCHASFMV